MSENTDRAKTPTTKPKGAAAQPTGQPSQADELLATTAVEGSLAALDEARVLDPSWADTAAKDFLGHSAARVMGNAVATTDVEKLSLDRTVVTSIDSSMSDLIKDAAKSLVRVVHSPRAGAKPIETRYRVADERGGIARVELEPITGRTHQLRAHMEDFGHPLLGDDKYGDRELNRRAPGPLRLWCGKLALNRDCPLADYRGQTFAAPPPEWWNLK